MFHCNSCANRHGLNERPACRPICNNCGKLHHFAVRCTLWNVKNKSRINEARIDAMMESFDGFLIESLGKIKINVKKPPGKKYLLVFDIAVYNGFLANSGSGRLFEIGVNKVNETAKRTRRHWQLRMDWTELMVPSADHCPLPVRRLTYFRRLRADASFAVARVLLLQTGISLADQRRGLIHRCLRVRPLRSRVQMTRIVSVSFEYDAETSARDARYGTTGHR